MQIQTEGTFPQLPEEQEENFSLSEAGIAVDVGTSTVAVNIWSLGTKKCLATVAEQNVQIRYGYDVIKRISFATRTKSSATQQLESPLSILHYSIIEQLEKLFTKVISLAQNKLPRGVRIHVSRIVITGNTTMMSFVCGADVSGLQAAPFSPSSLFGFTTTWEDVRRATIDSSWPKLDCPEAQVLQIFSSSLIDCSTPVYFPPCVGAFIGSDAVCSMLSAGFPSTKEDSSIWQAPVDCPLLLADIGTNSEIALYIPKANGKPAKILCTSAAAGPAFEGSNISCGMSSTSGAIESLTYKGELISKTIDDTTARGICGSGLISAVSTLLKHKFIDKAGVIQRGNSKLADGSNCIPLTPAVYLTQQDIRNVQLAKSAVYIGLSYMIEHSPSLPVFCIAGGFGTHINIEEACNIKLIPNELKNRCVHLGNASLAGASALLFSKKLRQKASEIAKSAFQINLAGVPDFQSRYLHAIDFN